MPGLIGKVLLSQFRVDEFIDAGGMGSVYRVWDIKRNVELAMKVLHADFAEDPSAFKYFQREARALEKLRHPNIVPFYGMYQDGQQVFLLEQYVNGPTLRDIMKGHPQGLSLREALTIMRAICPALGYAHANGVVHCDIKPGNIMLDNSGQIYLADFGIARHAESTTTTMAGAGTPAYMAPEQIREMPVNAQTDVYSLGVVLFEMLTGQRPFRGDEAHTLGHGNTTGERIRYAHLHLAPPNPSTVNPSVSQAMSTVILKALQKQGGDRHTGTVEFLQALIAAAGQSQEQIPLRLRLGNRASASATPPKAPPSAVRKPVRQKNPSHSALWVLFGIGIVSIFMLLMAGAMGFLSVDPPFIRVMLQATLTAPPTEIAWSDPTQTPSLTPSPTNTFTPLPPPTFTPTPTKRPTLPPTDTPTRIGGEWIAFSSERSGNLEIYLIDTSGNNLTRLTNNGAHDYYPSWSPDGRYLVYQTNEGGDMELAVMEVATQQVIHLTNNDCADWGPVWSPDGQWIAFYSNCSGNEESRDIYKIRSDGSNRQQLTFTPGAYSWFPAWSPDGSKITFTSNRSEGYHIYIMNADGSNQVELVKGCISSFSPDGNQILYGIYCNDTSDLWLMNADGSNQRTLTSGYECKNATWSPDGQRIVFQVSQGGKEGPFALYILSLAAPDPSNWIMIADYNINGISPVWQP